MKNLIPVFSFVMTSLLSLGQSPSPLQSIGIQFSRTNGPDSVMVEGQMEEKIRYLGTLVIHLEDTEDIDQVLIGMGSTSHASNHLSKTFLFSSMQTRNGEVQYARVGEEIRIHLGEFDQKPTGYAWVRLRMDNMSYTGYLEETIN